MFATLGFAQTLSPFTAGFRVTSTNKGVFLWRRHPPATCPWRRPAADRYLEMPAYAAPAICLPRRLGLGSCVHSPPPTGPRYSHPRRLPPTKQTSSVRACNMRKERPELRLPTQSLWYLTRLPQVIAFPILAAVKHNLKPHTSTVCSPATNLLSNYTINTKSHQQSYQSILPML